MLSMFVRFERKLVAVSLAASIGATAGCADSPTTSATYRSPDSRAFAENAMSTGPMLVRIRGRPYAVPEEQIDQAALSAMTQAMSWTATPRLTTDPAAAKTRSMVVVMTFNGLDARAQCRGESQGGEPQPQGAVRVSASFCGDGTLISNTTGRIDTSSGAGDPLFAELIRQVADDLFPQPEQQPLGTGIRIGGSGGGIGIGTGGGIGIGIGTGGIGIGF